MSAKLAQRVASRRLLEDCLLGSYRVRRLIGHGAFSDIFEAAHKSSGQLVALKLERADAAHPKLPQEAAAYGQLEGADGFPRIHWFGSCDHAPGGAVRALAMDMLGPSLQQLHAAFRRDGADR